MGPYHYVRVTNRAIEAWPHDGGGGRFRRSKLAAAEVAAEEVCDRGRYILEAANHIFETNKYFSSDKS